MSASVSGASLRACLDLWRERDLAVALHPVDRAVIDEIAAARELVAELLATAPEARDAHTACAGLGRLLAARGASPTLAATTIDGVVAGLTKIGIVPDDARMLAARACVAEGFASTLVERERAAARASWSYPACVVPLEDDTVAVAATPLEEDSEALADWAASVASALARGGVRRAVLGGLPRARAELADALGFVGIDVSHDGRIPPRRRRRFRLPFWSD